jgi:iron complex outermembrane receptor protein
MRKSTVSKKSEIFKCGLGFVVAIALLGTANAQDSNDSTSQLEEIIVTAQKRAESLQDIPMAITAFSGDRISEDGIKDLNDIQGRTPGLVVANFVPGQPEIAIRGIGTKEDGAAAGDSTVVSVDDVYIAARTAQIFDIFDLERVEVLRGPQGTLYGKNSIGGSINFITSKPTQETQLRIRQTVAEFETYDTAAFLSGGLSENLAGKISFSRRLTDGFIDHIPSGRDDTGHTDTLAYRAQLVWQASDAVEVTFTVDGADDEMGDTNREPFGVAFRPVTPPLGSGASDGNLNDYNNPFAVNNAMGALFGVDASDPHNSFSDDIGYTNREVLGFSARINWNIDDRMSFTSITSYRENEIDWLEDSEGLPAANNNDRGFGASGDLALISPSLGFRRDVSDSAIEDNDQFTQELRLSNSGDTSNWLVGLFYSEEQFERTESFYWGNFLNFGDWRTFTPGAPAPNYLGQAAVAPVTVSDQANEGTSWAAYGQLTWNLNDRMRVTGGLRYSYEEKEYTVSGQAFLDVFGDAESTIAALGIPNIDILNSTAIAVVIQNFDQLTVKDDWNNVSGRLAFDWDVAEDVLLYASVATGFKSGGFTGSPSTAAIAQNAFDPEEAVNFEAGVKSLLADRRVQINATAFLTNYDDLQVTFFTVPLGSSATFGEFFTENASSAKIQGLEVEFLALPVESFEIGGSVAFLDTEYEDFLTETVVAASRCSGSDAVFVDPGDISQGCRLDFSGNNLRQAPEFSANVFAKYTLGLASGATIAAKVDVRYQDDSFYDPDSSPLTLIPSYTLVDASIAYTSANGNWKLALWAKNLNDEDHVTHIFSQRGGTVSFANYGPPQQLGLTFTYDYGN